MPEDAEPVEVAPIANAYRALPVEEQAKLLAKVADNTAEERAQATAAALAHAEEQAARNRLQRRRP